MLDVTSKEILSVLSELIEKLNSVRLVEIESDETRSSDNFLDVIFKLILMFGALWFVCSVVHELSTDKKREYLAPLDTDTSVHGQENPLPIESLALDSNEKNENEDFERKDIETRARQKVLQTSDIRDPIEKSYSTGNLVMFLSNLDYAGRYVKQGDDRNSDSPTSVVEILGGGNLPTFRGPN